MRSYKVLLCPWTIALNPFLEVPTLSLCSQVTLFSAFLIPVATFPGLRLWTVFSLPARALLPDLSGSRETKPSGLEEFSKLPMAPKVRHCLSKLRFVGRGSEKMRS